MCKPMRKLHYLSPEAHPTQSGPCNHQHSYLEYEMGMEYYLQHVNVKSLISKVWIKLKNDNQPQGK